MYVIRFRNGTVQKYDIMMGGRFRHIGVSAFLIAIVLCSEAGAQGVAITLEGEVPIECRLDGATSRISLGAIGRRGSATIPFRVRCNTPFEFSMRSLNGALKLEGAGRLRPGFTDSIGYDADVRIPTSSGELSSNCASARLQADVATCNFPTSGDGVALKGDASLTFSWRFEREPVAGVYSDQLVLSVGPSI
jgi:hypothetical protein